MDDVYFIISYMYIQYKCMVLVLDVMQCYNIVTTSWSIPVTRCKCQTAEGGRYYLQYNSSHSSDWTNSVT